MRELEKKLIVGTKIKLGPKFCKHANDAFMPGQIIELVEGSFDFDNGLYTEIQTAPSIWNEDMKEFDSIYHVFENDLCLFMDCEIITDNQRVEQTETAAHP